MKIVPFIQGWGVLAGDIVLCSWERHLTLTVPLSTQVYKWVPVNCRGKPNKLRGNDLRWTSILSRGSRNTPGHFMLQKPGISSGSYGPLGSRLHFSFKAERWIKCNKLVSKQLHVEILEIHYWRRIPWCRTLSHAWYRLRKVNWKEHVAIGAHFSQTKFLALDLMFSSLHFFVQKF